MVPVLRAAGHEVVGLDSDLFGAFRLAPYTADFPEHHVDVRDVESRHLEGVEAVIHLAALSNDGLSNLNPEVTYDINLHATTRLAKLAKDAGAKRFLFSSSCSIYGKTGDALVKESDGIEVITPYTITKHRAEQALAKLACDAFSPTYLRNATAYGASPCPSYELVLNNLVAWAYADGRVLIKSDGTPRRPTVHVEDISRAFLAALEAPRETVHDQAFNVGQTEENYSVRELAEMVCEVVPGSRVEYAEGGRPDPRSYRVDFGKIRQVLPASAPKWTARRGAEQLYRDYSAAGASIEDFEGPRFKRLAYVQGKITEGRMDGALRWTTA